MTEIAPNTYRISSFHPTYHFQLNEFLVKDDEPFLMHTGLRKMFELLDLARVIKETLGVREDLSLDEAL